MLSFSRSSMIQLSSSGKLEADKKGHHGSGWITSPPLEHTAVTNTTPCLDGPPSHFEMSEDTRTRILPPSGFEKGHMYVLDNVLLAPTAKLKSLPEFLKIQQFSCLPVIYDRFIRSKTDHC